MLRKWLSIFFTGTFYRCFLLFKIKTHFPNKNSSMMFTGFMGADVVFYQRFVASEFLWTNYRVHGATPFAGDGKLWELKLYCVKKIAGWSKTRRPAAVARTSSRSFKVKGEPRKCLWTNQDVTNCFVYRPYMLRRTI